MVWSASTWSPRALTPLFVWTTAQPSTTPHHTTNRKQIPNGAVRLHLSSSIRCVLARWRQTDTHTHTLNAGNNRPILLKHFVANTRAPPTIFTRARARGLCILWCSGAVPPRAVPGPREMIALKSEPHNHSTANYSCWVLECTAGGLLWLAKVTWDARGGAWVYTIRLGSLGVCVYWDHLDTYLMHIAARVCGTVETVTSARNTCATANDEMGKSSWKFWVHAPLIPCVQVVRKLLGRADYTMAQAKGNIVAGRDGAGELSPSQSNSLGVLCGGKLARGWSLTIKLVRRWRAFFVYYMYIFG